MRAKRSRGGRASRNTILALAIIGLAALLACLVPVRDCPSCRGFGGLKIGQALDLSCKKCHGKGKQTVLEIIQGR